MEKRGPLLTVSPSNSVSKKYIHQEGLPISFLRGNEVWLKVWFTFLTGTADPTTSNSAHSKQHFYCNIFPCHEGRYCMKKNLLL